MISAACRRKAVPRTVDLVVTISGNGVMAAAKIVSDVPLQTPRHDVMMARENVHDAPPLRPKSAIPVHDVFMDMKHGDDRTKPLELVVVMTAIVNDDPHLDPERTHWEAAADHVLVLSNGLPSGTGPIQAVENAVQVDDPTAELRRSSDRVRSVIVLWILTSETESFSGIASGNVTIPERSNPGRLVGDVPQEHRGHSEIVAEPTALCVGSTRGTRLASQQAALRPLCPKYRRTVATTVVTRTIR